jgi:hypothetical protein
MIDRLVGYKCYLNTPTRNFLLNQADGRTKTKERRGKIKKCEEQTGNEIKETERSKTE